MSVFGNIVKGLSKVAAIVKQADGAADQAGPWLERFFPKQAATIRQVDDGLEKAAEIVIKAEVVGAAIGSTGPDKADKAGAAVAELLLDRLIAGKRIQDPALFRAGATKIASGLADVLNSVDAAEIR